MADLTDEAEILQQEHLARALARVNAAIPAGVAGECEDCGEDMPRLVDGRCAFCRDGRPHPFERRPSGASARVAPPTPVKEPEMPNPAGSRTVTFVAIGAVKDEIDRRAATGMPYGKAALELVEAGLARGLDAPVAAAAQLLLDLAAVPLADLLEELRDRVDRAAANDALLERALAAEAKLASIASVMAPGAGA